MNTKKIVFPRPEPREHKSIRLPASLGKKLAALSKKEKVSEGRIVETALTMLFKELEKPDEKAKS